MNISLQRRNKLEKLLNKLLLKSENFSDKEKDEVREEYLVHGEYSLAFSFYLGICFEENKIPLSLECKPYIDELVYMLKDTRILKLSKGYESFVSGKLTYQ